MARHQLDGFACADEQYLLLGQVLENLARQAHCGVRHRDGAGADGGVGAHLLGHREGLLKETVEDFAGGTSLVRQGEGGLHLSEDLRFAQHHGVKTSGHTEGVLHRLLVGEQIKMRLDVVRRQVVEVTKPLDRLVAVVRIQPAVHLGAVAGREDGGFIHAGLRGDLAQRLRQLLGRKRRLFANGDGRSLVIDAEGDEAHAIRGYRTGGTTGPAIPS